MKVKELSGMCHVAKVQDLTNLREVQFRISAGFGVTRSTLNPSARDNFNSSSTKP